LIVDDGGKAAVMLLFLFFNYVLNDYRE